MANKKLSDGVGKKIVEALKKQSEIEINPSSNVLSENDLDSFVDTTDNFESEFTQNQENFQTEEFSDEFSNEDFSESIGIENDSFITEEQTMQKVSQPFMSYQQTIPQDTFMQDLDTFEIPNNIAVLKKLITQLPSGVTRHTGAQIIKQTMEALGISMKSVLQEAQQVQEGLNHSVTECHSNIQEYKKQIVTLEKQAQNYQRQYSAMNELISLFIQTGI